MTSRPTISPRTLATLATVLCVALAMWAPIPAVAQDAPATTAKSAARTPVDLGTTGRWVVEFRASADLRPADDLATKEARGEFVVSALVATADASQAEARALVAAAPGATATSFWLRNVMIVEGPRSLLDALRALPEVVEVRPERVYPLVRPVESRPAGEERIISPEWGISRIGADAAWLQGVLGSGVVVANIDTGVDYTHPALVAQYRGNVGGGFSHDYNWWDPTGICGPEPCDNDSHGTHTMGTMVGGDGPGPFEPDIGVAPGAEWIAAKGCEDFGCSEFALLSSGEFMFAPTDVDGNNPDPSQAPDIVNNSWGGGPGDPFYLDVVTAWRAAGIIPVFSSGNPGPFCGAGGSPGDYNEALSAGATDIDDVIADFSGRGPSEFGKVNPDVSAPGVDVVSSVPGGGFAAFSGTSMASPHTAGSLALLLSAAPSLVGDFDAATGVLRATALDIEDLSCGGTPELNNVYGDGRIDALEAVLIAATGGTLEGTVTGSGPIAGARVVALDGGVERSATTDAFGRYKLFLPEGTYAVFVDAFGFETKTVFGVAIAEGVATTRNFSLTKLPSATVGGLVSILDGRAPTGAQVVAIGTPLPPARVGLNGRFSMELPLGSYTLVASGGPCVGSAEAIVNLTGPDVRRDFELPFDIDGFGYGCRSIDAEWSDAPHQAALIGDDVFGRLRLPFPFPFYGDDYDQMYVDSNGYLTFQEPFFSEFFNTEIPNPGFPNAAIYGMWQDLIVDDPAAITYGFESDKIVVEYNRLRSLFGSARFDMQIHLHRDGPIDLVFGDTAAFGSGRDATIGIEGPGGNTGLQLSFREPFATSDTAWRFEEVGTLLQGKVRDRNTNEPIAGAVVTADPGGRTTVAGSRGNYRLRLLPGDYTVRYESGDYRPKVTNITVGDRALWRNVSLRAGVAGIAPDSLAAAVEAGDAVQETVTINNTGTARLRWELAERETSFEFPELPPALVDGQPVTRYPTWSRASLPAALQDAVVDHPVHGGALETIITDPAGDASGSVDVTTVRAGVGSGELSLAIDFTPGTPVGEAVGYMLFDTDQNPATGAPPEVFFGLPTQDVGVEYFADLFALPFEGVVYIVDAEVFDIVAVVPAEIVGQSILFDIPLDAIADDGVVDVVGILGDAFQPTDWVPDVGKGSVQSFKDTPWMSASPSSGVLGVNQSLDVQVTLGGPGVGPGAYTGELVLVSNDPVDPLLPVAVTLDVTLPADFGTLDGQLVDSITLEPVEGTVTLDAIAGGEPYVVSAETGPDGSFQIAGPAGTWALDSAAPGYVDASAPVTITAGVSTPVEVLIDPAVPLIGVDGGPIDLTVTEGGSDSAALTVSNVGFADLEWSIVELDAAATVARPQRERGDRTSTTSNAGAVRPVTPRFGFGPWLVFMDAPPWDSFALLDVLDANGIAFDVAESSDMGTIVLSDYDTVLISNDQPQPFYNAYETNLGRFESYVLGGGILFVGAATQGFNGGEFGGAPMPGGVAILEAEFEELNAVGLPGHPLMDGVPDPFFGTFASHSAFADLPPGASVIAFGDFTGLPTLVEYRHGAGVVIGSGLTLEFGFEFGQDAGIVLENLVPYLTTVIGGSDVEWLSADPAAGTVNPGGDAVVTVTVDSTGLDPGTYEAQLLFISNDPFASVVVVPVTMEVLAAPPSDLAERPVQQDGDGG